MLHYGITVSQRSVLVRPARLGVRLAAAILAAGLAVAPATASATSFGSPALWNWLAAAAARALKAVEPPGDPNAAGSFAALNQTLGNGLNNLKQEGPTWLRRIDVGVNFREDFHPAYRVATVQPLVHLPAAEGAIEARGRLVYDPAGLTTSHIGLGYSGEVRDEPFSLSFYTTVDENQIQDHQRYTFGSELGWNDLYLHARLFNHIDTSPVAEESRQAALDGYHLDFNTAVPTLSWARVRASTFWHAALTDRAQPRDGSSVGLQLNPSARLVIETGTNDTNHTERQWFARMRFQLKFGEPR